MADRSRSRRSPSRYLAPLALAVAIAGTYLVVHHAVDKPARRSSATTRARHVAATGHSGGRRRGRTPLFYRVKVDDSLSTISARTGVSLPRIEELNPGVSSSSLQIGRRLRLRR